MAAIVLTDAFVDINGFDHSDHVRQVTLDISVDTPESTAMGATYRTRLLGGLKDASVQVQFNQDFVDDNVDEKLFAMLGTAVAIRIRPNKTAAIGAGNPEYQLTGVLTSHQPLGNAVGERADTTANFVLSSGTVVRDITP